MPPDSLSLWFDFPYHLSLRDEALPPPGEGQVLVQTLLSAISPGTEMLVYRGQFPADLATDDSIAALGGAFAYPLKYGYAAVGLVAEAGPGVDPAWIGRQVFAFNPHESAFLAEVDGLMAVPEGIPPEDAVFLPNMETAANLVMDGAPLLGEAVAVFGQGIVGLLTAVLLRRFPLGRLVTIDGYPLRRQASLELGVHASLDPADPGLGGALRRLLPEGADLVFELSGSPAALDQAIAATGYAGRVVIGSWYGSKRHPIDLGGRFHRSRIRLVSSQVSTIAPELSGRWSKARRFALAWELLRQVQPSRWITQRYPLAQAAEAYALLDQRPDEAIQVLITY